MPAVPTSSIAILRGGLAQTYRTTNDGASWTIISSLSNNTRDAGWSWTNPDEVFVIRNSPNTLFRSVDAGATFAAIGNPPSGYANRSLCVMPSGRILVGLENPNALTIAYTDDVGTTWTTVVVDPNALFKFAKERLFWWVTDSTLLFANSERVYRSTNGGVSWTAVLSDPQRFPDCLFVDYASPGPVVYCAASHQLAQVPYRMYRSSDAGATWVAVDEVAGKSGDNADSVRSRIVRTDTGVLLLIGGVLINGVRRQSFDDGFTWSPYTPPQNVWANVYRTKGALISYDPETGGVMRSTDHGASWTFTGLNIGANLSIPVFASAFGTLPLAGSGLRRGRLGIIGAPRLRRGLGGTPSSVIGPSSSPQSSPLSQPSEPLPQPSEPSPPSQPSSPQPPSRRPKKPKPQEPQTPR